MTVSSEPLGVVRRRLTWYRLRHPARHDQVFGDEIDDEQAALQRAARLADFYQHPIEVCEVVGGRFVRPVAAPVAPGPTVPVR
jgi:hypothetical protein